MISLSKSIAFLLLLLCASPASAQYPDQAPPVAPPAEPIAEPTVTADTALMTISVTVKHGADARKIANTPVFLRAARPRGPFEPIAPQPQFEWAGFTDELGIARFDRVPEDLTTSGLRIHAVTTYDGLAFESAAAAPLDGSALEIVTWDKSLDTSVVAIKNLRSVVEVWEGYLVFTQYYTLTNTGQTALDVKLLPDEEFEKGLPFHLPVKAKAINVTGPGESMVVNSTFYWKGVLEPGSAVNLQVRFSMSAKDSEFAYEQEMGWRTLNVEVVVPIQTRFEKLPRLHDLELRPVGFAETDRGAGIFDLRDDIDFVGARGLALEPGQSFAFQLRGLPFERAKSPFLVLLLAFVCGALVLMLASREIKAAAGRAGREDLRKVFEAQRERLLDELVGVERELDEGLLTRAEAEFEASALREQLALVLKKLGDLDRAE